MFETNYMLHTSGSMSVALQHFSATMLKLLSVSDFSQRAHQSLYYDPLWAEKHGLAQIDYAYQKNRSSLKNRNIWNRNTVWAVIVCLTSVSVEQSVCSEPVLPALWLLLTFSGNSHGSMSNISCCMSCKQFISFSLFVASWVLPDPSCFLQATVRWWVFLLHDTIRLTLPGLLPERLIGYLGEVKCSNSLGETQTHNANAVTNTKHAWLTSFCWPLHFYHNPPA